MLADKDMAGVTHILADAFDEWHVASLTGPRAATAAQLHEAMLTAGVEPGRIHEHADVAQALAAARESAVKLQAAQNRARNRLLESSYSAPSSP